MLRTHASQQPGDSLNVRSSEDIGQGVDHGETEGVDADPALSWGEGKGRQIQVVFGLS